MNMCQILNWVIGVKNEKYVAPTFQGSACCPGRMTDVHRNNSRTMWTCTRVFKPGVDEHPRGNAVSITRQEDPERTLQRGAVSWKISSSPNFLRMR